MKKRGLMAVSWEDVPNVILAQERRLTRLEVMLYVVLTLEGGQLLLPRVAGAVTAHLHP